jgi:hypothetical protein
VTFDVGQVASLLVEVHDLATGALTNATVVMDVTDPNGAVTHPTAANVSTGLYRAPVPLTSAGTWRWAANITGAVTDFQDGVIVVTPAGQDLPWTPQADGVAGHVPTRTIETGDTTGNPKGTFTTLTLPTRQQVDGFIADAVAHIGATVGTVDPSLYEMAREAAELRAAAFVEMAQPLETRNQQKVDTLLAQSMVVLDRLAEANVVFSGVDLTGPSAVLAQWSYPDPVAWGDKLL